jgi:hypothetical protein
MSELTSYKKSAYSLALEWEGRLTTEEYKTLYACLQNYTYSEWCDWKKANSSLIYSLVSSAPVNISRILANIGEIDRILYVFAASQCCLDAYRFLELADNCVSQVGIANRDMTALAAKNYDNLDSDFRSIWNWSYPLPYKDLCNQKPFVEGKPFPAEE